MPSLNWGIINKSIARDAYLQKESNKHNNPVYQLSGLHVHRHYSYPAASPDLISCKCCGEGLLEIKCPYKYRDFDPTEVRDTSFYLQWNVDGEVRLSQTHNYYSQVRGQLEVCDKKYCDFMYWSNKGIQVEIILRDRSFFTCIKPSLDHFPAYFVDLTSHVKKM